MNPLAQSADYVRLCVGLGSSPMATKPKLDAPHASPTLGQQVIAALIPGHFRTMTALQNASGLAYSTLSNWKNGTKIPDMDSVVRLARLAGVDPLDLLGKRRADATALRHHPDFANALTKALARFPNRLPRTAYEVAGDTSAAQWPEHVDELFVFNLAQFWWTNASDLDVMKAEEAEVRAEMAAVDAKRGG